MEKNQKPVSAVIDTGGGMRGIYAAGILEYCLENGIDFDICIGISAGSINLLSYLSGQRKRNYHFYTNYLLRPEYMSMKNLKDLHTFANLDYLFNLSAQNGKDPLDLKALSEIDRKFIVIATDSKSGEPVYFENEDISKDIDTNTFEIFRASCAIPAVSAAYSSENISYLDGTISDPVPIEKAIEAGAEKIVVIVNKPTEQPRKKSEDRAMTFLTRKNPEVHKKLEDRADRYNELLDQVRKMEEEGKALLLSPEDLYGVHSLSQDPEALRKLYWQGYKDGKKIRQFLESDIESIKSPTGEVQEISIDYLKTDSGL